MSGKELTNIFNYNGNKVEVRLNRNNNIEIEASAVARGLGWIEQKFGKEYVRWSRINGYLQELGFATCGESEFIPEQYVYLLAMKASNETALNFQKWLAFEVIPQIRKTGGYIPINREDDENTIMAKALLIARSTIDKKTEIIEQQKQALELASPKVNCFDRLMEVDDLYTMEEAAKLLSNGLKKPIGYKNLYKLLKKWKAVTSSNAPSQYMMNRGLMQLKTSIYTDFKGIDHVKNKTLVTIKGLEYIRKRLIELGEIKEIENEEIF
jgi:anti-repressor protein